MKTPAVDEGHSHTIQKAGKKHTWYVKRLWTLSIGLPEFAYEVSLFDDYDEDYWFGDRVKP